MKRMSTWVLSACLLAMIPTASSWAAKPGKAVSQVEPLVQVENAWIRATVAGQQATGGFMDLTASKSVTLVGFETNVARHAELHEMAMDGDVMRMRAISELALPAQQMFSLKPGAHHLMLTELKHTLRDGDTVSLTLLLKGEDGKVTRQLVKVAVKAPQMVPRPQQPDHHHAH